MPDSIVVVLDQNIPRSVTSWLRQIRPQWRVVHAAELGFALAPDTTIFVWAQQQQAIITTYDGDFADQRRFPLGSHHGVVGLRVFPTTAEATRDALVRLLAAVSDDDLPRALVVVDRKGVRLQPAPSSIC